MDIMEAIRQRHSVRKYTDEPIKSEHIAALQAEEEKSRSQTGQLDAIKAALEEELSFQGSVDSKLAASILDHVVIKKESTKDLINLEIHLKLGAPWEVAFDRKKGSVCFSRF